VHDVVSKQDLAVAAELLDAAKAKTEVKQTRDEKVE
jgi:hypothetical protein